MTSPIRLRADHPQTSVSSPRNTTARQESANSASTTPRDFTGTVTARHPSAIHSTFPTQPTTPYNPPRIESSLMLHFPQLCSPSSPTKRPHSTPSPHFTTYQQFSSNPPTRTCLGPSTPTISCAPSDVSCSTPNHSTNKTPTMPPFIYAS